MISLKLNFKWITVFFVLIATNACTTKSELRLPPGVDLPQLLTQQTCLRGCFDKCPNKVELFGQCSDKCFKICKNAGKFLLNEQLYKQQ